MKLQAITPIKSYSLASKINQNNKYGANSAPVSNSILQNSLSEVMGRSQVSFSGNAEFKNDIFTYTQNDLLGRIAEQFIYNYQTGACTYTKQDANGLVVSQKIFRPMQDLMSFTDMSEDDHKTTITITNGVKDIKQEDGEGRTVFQSREYKNGTKETMRKDYDLKRVILTRTAPDGTEAVEIYTFDGKRVREGELVKETQEVEPGVFRTYNLINGFTYKIEKHKGKTTYVVEFSEATGNRARSMKTNKYGTLVTFYNAMGIREKDVYVDKKGDKLFNTYSSDGMTAISTEENIYDSDKKLKTRISYQPGTKTIKTMCTIDRQAGTYTMYDYSIEPNVTLTSQKCDKRGNVLQYREYYVTGKDDRVVKYSKTRISRNETKEETFSPKGKRYCTLAIYKNNDIPYRVEKFDEETGKMYERREKHDGRGGYYTIDSFNYLTGILEKRQLKSGKDIVKMNIFYHENGKTVRKVQKFNPDRSYTVTYYDKKGRQVSTEERNPDSTLKRKPTE